MLSFWWFDRSPWFVKFKIIISSYSQCRQYNNISLSHQWQFLPVCQTEVLSRPDISFNLQNNESIRVVLKYSVHSKWWSNQRNNESWDIRSGIVLASMTSDVQYIAPYNKHSDPMLVLLSIDILGYTYWIENWWRNAYKVCCKLVLELASYFTTQ